MDVLKAIEEKAFWGHEFLTWLWFRAETEEKGLSVEGIGDISLWVDDMLVLESLESESKENILRSGDVSQSAEAAAGLSVGKKVTSARFGLRKGDFEWSFTLSGATFDVKGMKIPAVLPDEEDDPVEGTILVRLGHIRECMDVIDGLYGEYAKMRVGGGWEKTELPAMTLWISRKKGG